MVDFVLHELKVKQTESRYKMDLLHLEAARTFALFSVEGDLYDVRPGFSRCERHDELSLVDWSDGVWHAAVVDRDLQLTLASSTHVHCTPSVNRSS